MTTRQSQRVSNFGELIANGMSSYNLSPRDLEIYGKEKLKRLKEPDVTRAPGYLAKEVA